MSIDELAGLYRTHHVENQPPQLQDYNAFDTDVALSEALRREGGAWAESKVREFGELCGSQRAVELGFLANRNTPVLHTHDRFGNRCDEVEFHPAWHELMRIGVEAGVHSLPWNERRAGAHVARAALSYMLYQIEGGVGCPIIMTFAGVPALNKQPEVAEEWVPRLTSREYDPRFIPAEEKQGCLIGMAMTEKQGGSDVRSNTTRAHPVGAGGPAGEYLLTGHKWFCSAPMCDAFLTLAHADMGLSCFLVPRWLPDGTKNRFFIQRLKDKLGNRSNASSEIEYHDTWARMVGDEGRGVPTIIDMVNHTRLDCAVGSAALMRHAVAQAVHHTIHRYAFGRLLVDQPQMQNVLADLAVESEAATALAMRLARAYDEAPRDPLQAHFARIATPVAKYWNCKRAPEVVVEALECLGGAGYVEESIMPRLYREAPLNSIWEGSGNVMCLDVLRAVSSDPASLDALLAELNRTAGANRALDRQLAEIKDAVANADNVEFSARRLVEKMALALQAAILVEHGDPAVAEAFCASRLDGDHGNVFGTLPPGVKFKQIIHRARLSTR